MSVRCLFVLVSKGKQGGCGLIWSVPSSGADFFLCNRKFRWNFLLHKSILVVSTLLILVLTVGNVFSRKVIHRSWSFTEELVVAVFVLITLMAAALACREGELVNLSLVTDRLPEKLKKPSVILTTVLCIIFTAILFWFGMEKVITQLENGKRTFVLNWPEWIFWSFVPIGSGCMILHFIEYCLDYCTGNLKKEDK